MSVTRQFLLKLRQLCSASRTSDVLGVGIGGQLQWSAVDLVLCRQITSFSNYSSVYKATVAETSEISRGSRSQPAYTTCSLRPIVACLPRLPLSSQDSCSVPSSGLRPYCSTKQRSKLEQQSTAGVQQGTGQGDVSTSQSLSTERSTDTNQTVASQGGWSWREVLNLPNALSFARMLSGPAIAALVIQHQWEWAVGCLVMAGLSDYLDGFVAKRMTQSSVLGSYLDPLADKVLVCCVVAALGLEGSLSPPLVVVVVARDVFLVAGAFYHRWRVLKGQWKGLVEFFRISPSTQSQDGSVPAAPLVKPLFISKVNTVFQMLLVGAAMTHSWLEFPSQQGVSILGGITATTTLWSCAAYVRAYRSGKLLQ